MNTKWIATAGLALCAVWLVGCETPLPPDVERGPDGTVAYTVLVESSDPARVEVNREFVGNTPIKVKVFGDRDGTFHNFGSYEFIFQAIPMNTNQIVQTRVYRTGGILLPEDHIPQRIHFDMNQNPQTYPLSTPGYYYPPPPAYYYGPPAYYGPSFYWGLGYYGGYHGHHHHHSHGIHSHRR